MNRVVLSYLANFKLYLVEIMDMQRKMIQILGVLGLWVGMASPGLAQDEKALAELAARAGAILQTYCSGCHNPGSRSDYDANKVESMLNIKNKKGKVYLTPKDLTASLIWDRIVDETMPQDRDLPPDDRETLKKWIEAGCPTPPRAVAREFIPLEYELTTIFNHLQATRKQDRPYIRYFTMTHLYNNDPSLVSNAHLVHYRAALSKVLNSLSWKPDIVIPKPIDKLKTVYYIDIRDFDWDQNHTWRKIMSYYPYGLTYGGHSNRNLQKLHDDIYELTAKCELPYLRADWFIVTAALPPLYHDILKIPDNAVKLEQDLNVDIFTNFERNKLVRCGFGKSGVSEQNRLIERHVGKFGAYWKSYDFKATTKNSALQQFPLGPVHPRNKYNRLAFDHDGGEIIWNLPNGLQAYMLVDNKDKRIDKGPAEVVNDRLKRTGVIEIHNGLSCMTCHNNGMIVPPKDIVRTGTGLQGDPLRKVQDLYPEEKDLMSYIERDNTRFQRALEDAYDHGRIHEDIWDRNAKKITEVPEPVSLIAQWYRAVDMDARMVAAELHLNDPKLLQGMIRGNPRLREYGLGPLVQDGGTIKRYDWEKKIGIRSMMQRVAAEMEFSPINP